jgi:hypothetical protein
MAAVAGGVSWILFIFLFWERIQNEIDWENRGLGGKCFYDREEGTEICQERS